MVYTIIMGHCGGDVYVLLMVHSRWTEIAWQLRDTVEVRTATVRTWRWHAESGSLSGGFVESRRVHVYVLMCDCYRLAIDQMSMYKEKY